MLNFSKYDGSGRLPRPLQVQALREIAAAWNKPGALACIIPVAGGKSYVARAIQLASGGADIITPSNLLIDQYAETYKSLNTVKGKSNYMCRTGMSCSDWSDLCGGDTCESCPYTLARNRAAADEPTAFNPASFYYYKMAMQQKGQPVIIIDEAHQLAGLIQAMATKRLKWSEYKFTADCVNEKTLSVFLSNQLRRLKSLEGLYKSTNMLDKAVAVKRDIMTISNIVKGLDEDGQNFAIYEERKGKDRYLNIAPVRPPKFLLDKYLGGKKVVLLSATLFSHDIKDLVGNSPYTRLEFSSPIPRKNRLIKYAPAPFRMNYQTPAKDIVKYTEKFIPEKGNTLIHATYAASPKLAAEFSRPVLFNTKEDKQDKVREFIEGKDQVLLGAGLSEGLDLHGERCRTNILMKLSYPNLLDPVTQKRKAQPGGEEWFALETLKHAIQATGRSSRTTDDFSTCYILDPNFLRLFNKYKHLLPNSFVEAIEL